MKRRKAVGPRWRIPHLERLEKRIAPAGHDTLGTAISLPVVGGQAQASGVLAGANQVDLYAVSLQAGDEAALGVSAQAPGSLQSALRAFDGGGGQLPLQQSTGGLTFAAAVTGVYYVGVSSDGDVGYSPTTANSGSGGATSGGYHLTLSATFVLVTENPSNFTLQTAQTLAANTIVQGTYVTGTMEYYQFTVTTTGGLTASATPVSPTAFLPGLVLYGASGQLLIQSDGGGVGSPSAQLNQNLQPGTYYLAMSAVADNPSGDQSYGLVTTFDPALPPFQALPVRPPPTSVAVGDFNHDGFIDIVTTNANDNTVTVMLGRGDGTFLPAVSYPVGNYPDSVAVGDVNHDGNLDIATANGGDNTVTVMLGQGDGTFLPAVSYPVGTDPHSIAVGDFNHDGNLDIATANGFFYNPMVTVLLGRGDGTFLPAVSTPVGYGYGSIAVGSFAVGDFNHDGNLDIVQSNSVQDTVSDDTVWVMLGRGDGTFSPAVLYPVGSEPDSLAVGDFNHDGNLDIATANADDTVSVILGRGDGAFLPAVSYPVGLNPDSVAVGDFNHDGNLDIVTANADDGTVSVLLGRGDGSFLPAVSYRVGEDPESVAVGEFNQDGNLDIVTANAPFGPVNNTRPSTVTVLLGRGDGTFAPPASSTVGNDPASIAVGDFNHDGNLDVATANANDNTVTVLLGRGDGAFLPAVSYPVGRYPYSVAVGDFNNDGNLDLVTVNANSNTVSVLLGRGDGTFLSAVSYPVGNDLHFVAVGDFNHDGNLDLAVTNGFTFNPTVTILLGRGDGTFLPAGAYPVGSEPDSLAVGDFNHDGNLDIVTANAVPNTVSVLLGRGDGAFLPAVSYPVEQDPESVAVGDFNHDGNLDVVTANTNADTVSVLLGRGDGAFLPAVSYPVGDGPFSVVVGDFNDDGNLDIVSSNVVAHTVSVLLGRGDGALPARRLVSRGAWPHSVAVGDFNNDGSLDVATANEIDSTVTVLLGQGNGQFQPSTPADGVAIRTIPILQDLTGDGVPDSLILNSSGDLLFRKGLSDSPDSFAPPAIINPDNPVRDATVFQTASGWAVAAVDDAGNTVSIYTWDKTTDSFTRTFGFVTGDFPVRIAAADLTGDGRRDDLVVANDFDNSVTIAFAQGNSFAPMTRPVGVGPSDIAFLSVAGQLGLDVVVSDQVSGDYTVLLNDGGGTSAPTFSQEYRYRAGSGLFGISVDPITGEQSILSQLQTVAIAAGDFTGSGSDDLIVVNRNAKSFTLLPSLGQGRFADPQDGATYFPTSDQPDQIVALTLPGDTLASVAVLMEDIGQIWIYRNNGNGTFASPVKIDAGNDPTGFSVATVNGQFALLVGNAYGDILALLYDGNGGFAPDRANLQDAPLAVGTTSNGRQFAVVADQSTGQVALYYRIAGTNRFASPIAINQQTPLLAPGAVQMFSVPGDSSPYLVVAESLSNDVRVYHYDPATGGFAFLQSDSVGNDPVSITVAFVTASDIPDLVVANEGSNDISVLIGSLDPQTGLWTETPYQRQSSGGSGPLAVAVEYAGGKNGPSLLVSNSDGTVSLLPGIGSGGKGSGFFAQPAAQPAKLDVPIVQSLFDTTSGQLFVVGANGSLSVLTGDAFTSLPVQGVATLGAVGGFLAAGFADGSVGLLESNGTELASVPSGFTDEPSALEVLKNGGSVDVFLTEKGNDVPLIVSFALNAEAPIIVSSPFIPVVTEVHATAPVAQGSSVAGNELVLVAVLVSGGLVDAPTTATGVVAAPAEEVFALFISPGQSGAAAGAVANVGGGEVKEIVAARALPADGAEVPAWEAYPLGAAEALCKRLERRQIDAVIEQLWEEFNEGVNPFNGFFEMPAAFPDLPDAETAEPAGPVLHLVEDPSTEACADHSPEQPAAVLPGDLDVEVFDQVELLAAGMVPAFSFEGDGGQTEDA